MYNFFYRQITVCSILFHEKIKNMKFFVYFNHSKKTNNMAVFPTL